jgi:hypothetical protein
MPHRARGSGHIVGFGGQTGETSNGFAADLLVGIGARNVRQQVCIVKARHRCAAHTRVGVLACERAKRFALVWSYFENRRGTHRGIGVFPTGSWTKFFENSHRPLTVA